MVGLLVVAATADGVGGLQVNPLRIDASPTPGIIGRIRIANPSPHRMSISVEPRRWHQTANGDLAPGMRKIDKLRILKVSPRNFVLAPNAGRVVEVLLALVPRKGFLYATVVARGQTDRSRSGLDPRYQIATAVHLEPKAAKRRFRLRASHLRAVRHGRRYVSFAVTVRNLGNMVDPVGGTLAIRGNGLNTRVRISARPVLPEAKVRLRSARLPRLRPGTYRVIARLIQRGDTGRARATTSRRFRVLRGGNIK